MVTQCNFIYRLKTRYLVFIYKFFWLLFLNQRESFCSHLFFCFFFFFVNLAVKHSYSKEKYVVLPPVTKKSYVIISDHHLFHTCQLSRIRHQSPGLPYWSPYLPDKIIFWSLLCLSLRFSPFSAQNVGFLIRCMVSGAFLHPFSHWQRLCLPSKWGL